MNFLFFLALLGITISFIIAIGITLIIIAFVIYLCASIDDKHNDHKKEWLIWKIYLIFFGLLYVYDTSYTKYIWHFSSWECEQDYIYKNNPSKYINKIFSITLNDKNHYFQIVSDYTIEEVNFIMIY